MIATPRNMAILLLVSVAVGASAQTTPIYSYSVPLGGGYAANGNLLTYSDTVTGTWTMQYDSLNRLQTATASAGTYQALTLSWGYDSFGNRLNQTPSGTSNVPVPAAVSATYNTNNQMQSSSIPGVGPQSYDAAGNLIFDGINKMAYDAENRLCATYNTIGGTITQYIYDADGNRIAKVNATSLNGNALTCAVGAAGPVEATYLLGQSGEQVTELDGSGNWQHTNVYATGQLLATYDQEGSQQLLHFNIGDPLGTKRVQASGGGVAELTCLSLPFGDSLNCTGAAQDATAHHFTGKERDTESGLYYFGARYYASTMGRWMSPDPSMESAIMELPQTWNKYSYVYNRPTYATDPDGRCPPCIGAIVGGVVEGGWNLGSQLASNHGDLGAVNWRDVGANAAGGAVAGAIAGATGGASLLVDAAVGAGANAAGGIVTRTAEGDSASDVLSAGDVSTDALAGFVGGGAGHLAAKLIHVPDDPGPRPKNNGHRRLENWKTKTLERNSAQRASVALGTVSGSPVIHTVDRLWDWLMFAPPPPPPAPKFKVTVTISNYTLINNQ